MRQYFRLVIVETCRQSSKATKNTSNGCFIDFTIILFFFFLILKKFFNVKKIKKFFLKGVVIAIYDWV